MSEVIRCMLLCMLEAVEGRLCLPEVPEAMRRMLLGIVEAVEGRLCLLEKGGAGGDASCAALYAWRP